MARIKTFKIVLDGVEHVVQVEEMGGVSVASAPAPAPAPAPASPAPAAPAEGEVVGSPLQGKVFSLNVNVGDVVKRGDTLLVIEAMKMENEIPAPRDGEVVGISVAKGDQVAAGDPLVVLK